MRKLRLRFWLCASDIAHAVDRVACRARGLTSKLHFWTIGKASDAEDWGVIGPADYGTDDEVPGREGGNAAS